MRTKKQDMKGLPPFLPKCVDVTLEDCMDTLVLHFDNIGTNGQPVPAWVERIDTFHRPDGLNVFRGGTFREAFIKEMATKVTDARFPRHGVGIAALKDYRNQVARAATAMKNGYDAFLTEPARLAPLSADAAELVKDAPDLPWALLLFESVVLVLHKFATGQGDAEIDEAKITAQSRKKKQKRGRLPKKATKAGNAKETRLNRKSEKQTKTTKKAS